LAHESRAEVGGAAGSKTDHEVHRPGRIGLRSRDARERRERGSARGNKMQKSSTVGKFHRFLPAASRNSQLDAISIKDQRSGTPADGILAVIAIIGFRHVPLTARRKCYSRFGSKRKGASSSYVLPCMSPFTAPNRRASRARECPHLGGQRRSLLTASARCRRPAKTSARRPDRRRDPGLEQLQLRSAGVAVTCSSLPSGLVNVFVSQGDSPSLRQIQNNSGLLQGPPGRFALL
jgi:hypothetical protein